MTVSNSKTPTSLDEAVRMFKGYVRGENGFDELDFKEWLIEWREQEIAEAILSEIENIRGLDLLGTLERIEKTHKFVEHRKRVIEALRTKEK